MNDFLNHSRKFARHCVRFGVASALTAGLIGFAPFANARGNSQSTSSMRQVQQQLKNDGYYSGKIDGVDGAMTRSAIRQYQKSNNLPVTGRLDQQTKSDLLSAQTNPTNGNNPQTNPNNPNSQTSANTAGNTQTSGNNNSNMANNSTSNIQAAQQLLQEKGLYNGVVNGVMNPQTQTAIRHFQQNNNLSVTGRLDQKTLNTLGITNHEKRQ